MLFLSFLELSEDDTTSNCINYPTQSYLSYADCDRDFIRKQLPVDLVPFWTVPLDDISLASNTFAWNGSKAEFKLLLNKLGKNNKYYKVHTT